MTPVPKRMNLVRSSAIAMKISGELMISNPVEWCSPIQASSNPGWSSQAFNSRSGARQAVGFSSVGWNGGRKTPSRRVIWLINASLSASHREPHYTERGRNGDQARKDPAAGYPCQDDGRSARVYPGVTVSGTGRQVFVAGQL